MITAIMHLCIYTVYNFCVILLPHLVPSFSANCLVLALASSYLPRTLPQRFPTCLVLALASSFLPHACLKDFPTALPRPLRNCLEHFTDVM